MTSSLNLRLSEQSAAKLPRSHPQTRAPTVPGASVLLDLRRESLPGASAYPCLPDRAKEIAHLQPRALRSKCESNDEARLCSIHILPNADTHLPPRRL